MGIYKTYKEAVLANGSTNGVCVSSSGDEFYTDESWLGRCSVAYLCSPVDYLESMADFISSGKMLINGDLVIDSSRVVQKVYAEGAMNKPDDLVDNEIFILKAAAYDTETPEEKEAFDAIPNKTTIDAKSEKHCGVGDVMVLTDNAEYSMDDQYIDYLGKPCIIHHRFINNDGLYMNAVEFGDGFCCCIVSECLSHSVTPEDLEMFEGMVGNSPQQFESLSKVEWDGEGLPPVGAEFYFSLNGKCWSRYVMLFNDGVTFLMSESKFPANRYHYKCDDPDLHFRKPETPEQREERERNEAIDEMMNFTQRGVYSAIQRDLCAKLYDAGYRKEK